MNWRLMSPSYPSFYLYVSTPILIIIQITHGHYILNIMPWTIHIDVVHLSHISHLLMTRKEPAMTWNSASPSSSFSSLASLVSHLPQQLNGQPLTLANQKRRQPPLSLYKLALAGHLLPFASFLLTPHSLTLSPCPPPRNGAAPCLHGRPWPWKATKMELPSFLKLPLTMRAPLSLSPPPTFDESSSISPFSSHKIGSWCRCMLVQAWRRLSNPQIWSSWAKFVQNLAVISVSCCFRLWYELVNSAESCVQIQIEWFKVPQLDTEKIYNLALVSSSNSLRIDRGK